ncbi:hypothetical protein [Thermoflexus hugenholtzii]
MVDVVVGTLLNLATAGALGFIGNRSDALLCGLWKQIYERWRRMDPPANHDLQRAIRKALLQATLALLADLLKERGWDVQSLLNSILARLPFARPKDAESGWLVRASRGLADELARVSRAEDVPPPFVAEEHLADLLRPQGVTASERAGKAWEELTEAWLEELRGRFGEPPEAFVRALRGGGQPPGADKPVSWPDRVSAYFAHEIKRDPRVARILYAQLLADLKAEQRSLSEALRDHLEQRFADVLRRLEDIRKQVEELAHSQREGFEELRGRLEEIVASLLTLQETPQTIQRAIEDLFSVIKSWIEWMVRRYGESHVAAALDRATRKFLEARRAEGFAGRAEALARLNDFVERERSGVVVVYAPAGYGKTAFLAHWIGQVEGQVVGGAVVRVVHHFFDPAHPAAHLARQPSYAYAYLLAQLYRLADRPDPIPSSEDERWAALDGFFADLRVPEGEKWVLVLDGLDNAEGKVIRFVPEKLPDGLFVVVSGRWDGAGEEPSYLEEWAVSARRLRLEALSEEEVREWLRGAGDAALAPLAENRALVRMLWEKTEGFPLFLRYLLDDLAQAVREGKSPEEVLRKTPEGFSAYVSEQLKDLAQRLRNEVGFRKLFALLTVARGPLRLDEVEELTGLYAMDLEAIPHPVVRWLAIGRTDPPEEQPTYAFAHPLLAEEFRKQLRGEAEEMEGRLLRWCEERRGRPSPYILRHYADHLYARWQRAASRSGDPSRDPEARSLYSRMYELALDGEFARAQARDLPEEPHLPLATVQRALDAAVRWEDAPAMARLLLEHARRARGERGTPLEAWRQGHREGALRMTGIVLERDWGLGALWGLLLAWAAEQEGEREWARRSLEEVRKRLEKMKGMALRDWQEEAAVFLLGELAQVEGAIEVAGLALDDSGKQKAAGIWASRGLFDLALKAAEGIDEAWSRAEALRKIAVAMAEAGQGERAKEVLNQALKAAEGIDEAWSRAEALKEIAVAMARAGELEQALKAAEGIDEAWSRAWALRAIAVAMAEAGQGERAKEVLNQALKAAEGINKAWSRAEALRAIAVAMAKAGELEQALKAAEGIDVAWGRAEALRAIAAEMAKAGEVEGAAGIVEQATGLRAELLTSVLSALAEWAGKGDGRSKEFFLKLLPLRGWSLELAYRACALLARWYPEQGEAIAGAVSGKPPAADRKR